MKHKTLNLLIYFIITFSILLGKNWIDNEKHWQAITQDIENLSPDLYIVTVTDNLDCEVTDEVLPPYGVLCNLA